MKKFNGYANSLAFFLAVFLAFGLFVGCKEAEPEPPKGYMVTYILDDSIANEDSFKNIVLPKNGKVEENTGVTLESLTVTGWTFDGWFVDNQKVNTTDYKIVKDTNFVAKFTKIQYMVTYTLDDSIANEDSFKNIVLPKTGKDEENTVVTLELLTVTGWTFDGWFVDNQKVNATEYKIAKDTNFVAKFTKIKTPTESGSNTESGENSSTENDETNQEPTKNQYMVAYILDSSVANEGSFKNVVLPKTGKVEENTVVTLESLSVTGWTFDGWFVDNQKVNTTDYKIVKDTNFVAKFTKIDSGEEENEEIFTPIEGLFMFKEEMNPEYASRTDALDTIFNPDELGEIVLVFDRSEWNKHLYYCDMSDNKHEDSVKAKGFYFTKDNKEWFFKDIGFRIRGNTSRKRPQEGNGAGNNDYVQAHFALDFEEWITDEQDEAGVEKKLANSMKGLILKRFKDDPTYSREVYSYNLFRQNGIWISPRASYTTLKIQIVDDLDLDKDGDKTEYETVNYGVYGMIEEIKKQFLKERTKEEGGGEFSNNKGNLWKCLGANFKDTYSIGEEDVYFEKDASGNITNFVRNTFAYDYKSDDFDSAKTQLLDFIAELNNLPDCTDGENDELDIETIEEFYTNKMDGDLFLRTYAINVILGMWDDYWINNNNYYFYFDKKTGKAYFIPYDYDNSLGVSHMGVDAGTHNPLVWGNLTDGNHPLIQKILQVPEYMNAYKYYLDLYSNENSHFDDDKSIAQITKWQEMIKPYINSPNLRYHDTTSYLEDKSATDSWADTYRPYTLYTPGEWNFFTVRQAAIKNAKISSDNVLTLNAGKGYFYTENGDVQTLSYTFTTGDKLSEILVRNGFSWRLFSTQDEIEDYWIDFSYEEDGLYYYRDWFVDSEGNYVDSNYSFYESTTLDIKYNEMHEVTLDFNGVEYGGKESVKRMIPEYLQIAGFTSGVLPGILDDKVFTGWSYDQEGNYIADYLDLNLFESDRTLYAVWNSLSSLDIPYYFSDDKSSITFVFNPLHYNITCPDNAVVYLMFNGNGWKPNEKHKLEKQDDGTYTLSLNWEEEGPFREYKFFIQSNGQWCGGWEYNRYLPETFLESSGNKNFIVAD